MYYYNKGILMGKYESVKQHTMGIVSLDYTVIQMYYPALYHLLFNSSVLMYMVILCLLCKSLFLSIVYTIIMCHYITVSSCIPPYPIIDSWLNRSTCIILYEKCNPLYTSQYTFSAVNTQFIVQQ